MPIAPRSAISLAALTLATLSCTSTKPRDLTPVAASRLVDAPGLVATPAISPDGLSIAYASDQGDSTNLNLWIRTFDAGTPRRLTNQPADHTDPSFSADGKTIAFRSEGDQPGVYLIPAEGGTPKLLAPGGRKPRYSPDGKTIAYTAADKLYLIDPQSSQPQPFHPEFASARDAVWAPDGKHLLFNGCKGAAPDSCDWWIAPIDTGVPVATGAAKILRAQHLTADASPEAWLPGNSVLVTAKSGEKSRIWALTLTPNPWRAEGKLARITSTEQDERTPAVAASKPILFASRTENIDVYTLPLDADQAKVTGSLTRITTDPSIDQRPTLSIDGRKLAWETSRGGNFEVWVKDLTSGKEQAITSGPLREHMPAISRDGSKLVYDAHDGDKVTVFEVPFAGGQPTKITEENVGQGSFQFTAAGRSVLYFHREPPGTVGIIDLATKKRTVLLRHPKLNLSIADARLSPDGKWIAFPVPFAPHRSRMAVAAVTAQPIEEKDWIYLTPETYNVYQPDWSPNGRWLYFLSDQPGRLTVQALELPAGKKPTGEPRLIFDFPSARLTMAEMRPRDIGLAIAKDKLAFSAAEYKGGLWSLAK